MKKTGCRRTAERGSLTSYWRCLIEKQDYWNEIWPSQNSKIKYREQACRNEAWRHVGVQGFQAHNAKVGRKKTILAGGSGYPGSRAQQNTHGKKKSQLSYGVGRLGLGSDFFRNSFDFLLKLFSNARMQEFYDKSVYPLPIGDWCQIWTPAVDFVFIFLPRV